MLQSKVISSVKWLAILRYTSRSLDFIKILILARYLSPADFGIFALATTTINTLEALTETGFQFAFIQLQEDMRKFAKTLWIISIGRGALLSILALLLSSFLSSFFHAPQLLWFLVIASLIPFIKGCENPYVILFQKNLNFKLEFTYRFIPSFIQTILSVIFVIYFRNPIWLVAAIVIGTVVGSVFSFIITPSDFRSGFKPELVRKLFTFGKSLTIGSLFTFLMTQVDNIFVGRIFGTQILGMYDIMFKVANLAFSEVTDIVARVAFPFFASIQKNQTQLKSAFLKNLIMVSIPALIASLLFIFYPTQIIFLLLGKKWVNGASLLQILAIYGFFRACMGTAGPLFLAKGQPHILTITSGLNLFFVGILIYPFSKLFGITGVAWAMSLAYALSLGYLSYHLVSFFKNDAKLA